MEHPVKTFGWAARDPSGVLSPFKFSRRATREHDVQLKVLYCGICHSDLHLFKNELGFTTYSIVPGHEIVGSVTEVGSNVQKVKVGDKVGVGCMVGSCRKCVHYNSVDSDSTTTYGGYSDILVVDEHFIVRWPKNFPLDKGAPLLCAGITAYSPLRYYGLDKPGLHVGVVGLGSLGHVAVKFLKAFEAKVMMISTSVNKKKEAIETLGADAFVVSREPEKMQVAADTLEEIIDTVSAAHPIQPLISLLKPHVKMVMLGVPDKPLELPVFPLISARKTVAGSLIGGLKETQEMIDFAAKHNILPDVDIISMDYVNTAMDRLAKADVKYRFAIDVAKTLKTE
ncbi:hypothetical protein BUALT_Bualt08G0090000 [Buddleja alternifolia]|uniref:Enoyl reductase (ER) domain-containing protein n=1 Tax=Buddleja alternifolia TaxID=168488 RepID=A0AAV6XFV6_9LAMI|nr:hypothetical protein BUALT_Bualt08G0090000 [Buddleja alternifolia]